MYCIDENQDSLVIIHFESPLTVSSAEKLFAYMNSVLDKQQTFGFAMDSNVEGQHERGVAKMQKDWAKDNRERLGKYCAGVAIVTQSNRYISLYKPIANVIIKRIYNCPGKLFVDIDDAKNG